MSTAVAKKTTASPKRSTTDASNKSKTTKTTKTPKSTKPAKPKTPKSSKSKTRKTGKADKKKGGFFSCCSSKRKVKRTSKKRSGAKKRPVRKVPAVGKSDPKSQKSAKKSAKEIAAAKAAKAQISQKKGAQKTQDPAKKVPSPKRQAPIPPAAPAAPLRSGSNEPTLAPQPAQTPTTPSLTSATQTEQMVTAPSGLAPPVGDSKSFSQEPAVAQSPKDSKPEEKKPADDAAEDDEPSVGRKSVSYPSHKFFMTQYVKDDCRIRRWVYEDSVPLAMESNMRHMLKVASVRLAHCRNENERRGEMLKDLNQLSQILDGPKK